MKSVPPRSSPTRRYEVPALDKGLDILEALASCDDPLSLSDLAARLGRSRNEIFRMIECLVDRGYVLRDPATGRSSLSLKLHQLANAHSPIALLLRHAREPMRRFVLETGESCHLSVLDPGGLLVIHAAHSASPVRLLIETGVYFDPVLTASGRLLLADMSFDERDAVLEGSRAWAGMRVGGKKKFLAGLEALTRGWVSRASDETIQGVRDASVLVGGRGGAIRAALAISVFARATDPSAFRALESALSETAAIITSQLELKYAKQVL